MKKKATDRGATVRFELSAAPGSDVFVAGTFNHWSPTANALTDNPDSGHFTTALRVPSGAHEYKFVVNGVWTVDPQCAERVENDCGSLNSVLRV